MNKFVLALLFFVSTLAFAQDGRTKVNYYNQTSQNIRMLIDGRPACTGDVIPGGACTEFVNPGTYLLQATNGQQTTSGYTCMVAYGEYCTYTVTEHSADLRLTPGLSLASYQPIALLNYGRFSVNAPVQLKKGELQNGTTDFGKAYTATTWSTTMPNGDWYGITVADYPFQTVQEDLDRSAKGYAAGVKGTVIKQESLTVSGQPAAGAVIDSVVNNRNYRSALLIVIRGNSAYMFIFVTDMATPDTDMNAVNEFFNSASLS